MGLYSEGYLRLRFGGILRYVLTSAYLTPNVDCSSVTSPETKNIVLSTSLMASVLFVKHIGPLRMKGIASVPPNIVR